MPGGRRAVGRRRSVHTQQGRGPFETGLQRPAATISSATSGTRPETAMPIVHLIAPSLLVGLALLLTLLLGLSLTSLHAGSAGR